MQQKSDEEKYKVFGIDEEKRAFFKLMENLEYSKDLRIAKYSITNSEVKKQECEEQIKNAELV